jgi:hypothetical protein
MNGYRGELSRNSPVFQYLQRQYAVSQIINSYFRALSFYSAQPVLPALPTNIHGNVWRSFLATNRYLGGATNADIPGLLNADNTPGPAISAFINGAYSQLQAAAGNNPAAVYSSFLEQHTVDSISVISEGNLSSAMREMRNFIVSNNLDLANVLRSVGEGDIGAVLGTAIGGNANPIDAAAIIRLVGLFSGMDGETFNNLEITNAALFGGDIRRVSNAIRWALSNMNNARNAIYNINTKPVFNISPYFALKAGYFIEEIKTCLYLKIGAIHLNGRVTAENSIYAVKDDRFNKITPFFSVGVTKNLNKHFCITLEISKILPITKNITINTPYGFEGEKNVKINKTNIAFIAAYKF